MRASDVSPSRFQEAIQKVRHAITVGSVNRDSFIRDISTQVNCSDRSVRRWIDRDTTPKAEFLHSAYHAITNTLAEADHREPPSPFQDTGTGLIEELTRQYDRDWEKTPANDAEYQDSYAAMHEDLEYVVQRHPNSQYSETLARCFAEPKRYYYPGFDETQLGFSQTHSLLLSRMNSCADRLRDRPITLLVPLVMIRHRCIVKFMCDYFQLNKMTIQEADISHSAVKRVSSNGNVDFFLAACVTVLTTAKDDALKYRFGTAGCKVQQEVVFQGKGDWKDARQIPLAYVKGATGAIHYWNLEDAYPEKFKDEPQKNLETFFRRLADAGSDNKLSAFALWQPAVNFYRKQQKLRSDIRLDPREHLTGLFVHSEKWREPGKDKLISDDERAFYDLMAFASAMFSLPAARYLPQMLNDKNFLRGAKRSMGIIG